MPEASPINLTNQFLIAMPGMGDDTFSGTVIYLCEHNEKGALGLVINRPIDIKLSNLFEKVDLRLGRDDLAEAPVYFGGPVQTERGFVLHEPLAPRAPEGEDPADSPYNATLHVPGGLEMTTSRDVLEAMSQGAGQLEDELSRNGWLSVPADPGIIFDTPAEQRYERALALLGISSMMLSQEAGHA